MISLKGIVFLFAASLFATYGRAFADSYSTPIRLADASTEIQREQVPAAVVVGYRRCGEDRFGKPDVYALLKGETVYVEVAGVTTSTGAEIKDNIIARVTPVFDGSSVKEYSHVDVDANGVITAFRELNIESEKTEKLLDCSNYTKIQIKKMNSEIGNYILIEAPIEEALPD